MQKSIPVEIKNGQIFFDQGALPLAWLDEPLEAIVKDYGILIKPRSLSQRLRGIVEPRLSDEAMDNLYAER